MDSSPCPPAFSSGADRLCADHARAAANILARAEADVQAALDAPTDAIAVQLARTAPAAAEDAGAGELVVHATDFVLAAAAAAGDRRAIAAIEARYAETVRRAMASARVPAALADDVRQAVWESIFFGRGGSDGQAKAEGRPGIGTYSGRGPLAAWLHVSIVREAQRKAREAAKFDSEPSLDDELDREHDAELEYMKRMYAEGFREAFREALGALTSRQRNLLRYTYVDNLTADAVATLYGVHRVTVARWLGDVRADLAQETRRILAERFGLAEDDSVLALIQSRLDMSLSALASEDG